MDTYLLMIYVTVEQERAIQELFHQHCWPFTKQGSGAERDDQTLQDMGRKESFQAPAFSHTSTVISDALETTYTPALPVEDISRVAPCFPEPSTEKLCQEAAEKSQSDTALKYLSPVKCQPVSGLNSQADITNQSGTSLNPVSKISRQYVPGLKCMTDVVVQAQLDTDDLKADIPEQSETCLNAKHVYDCDVDIKNVSGTTHVSTQNEEDLVESSPDSDQIEDEEQNLVPNETKQDGQITSDAQETNSFSISLNKLSAEKDVRLGTRSRTRLSSSVPSSKSEKISDVYPKVELKSMYTVVKERRSLNALKKARKPIQKYDPSAEKTDIDNKPQSVADDCTEKRKGEFHCKECGVTFKLLGAYRKHQKNGKCLFRCEYCGRIYRARYYSNYILHVKYHKKERLHKCSVCGKSFVEKTALTIHLRTHSGEKPYVCDVCGRAFISSGSLISHKKHHQEEREVFQCEICGAKLGTNGNLAYHKRMVHTEHRPYECHICHKRFKTKKALEKLHATVHQAATPFKCEMCPKSFKRKAYLLEHLRRHRNEKRHFCDRCGKGFYRQDDLEKHMRSHTGDKPYHCTLCHYKCALRENLKKHLKIHESSQKVLPTVLAQTRGTFDKTGQNPSEAH